VPHRHRPGVFALAFVLATLLAACSTPPRIYSDLPVHPDGSAVEIGLVRAIVLEAQGRRVLARSERLSFGEGFFEISDDETVLDRFALSGIASLEVENLEGELELVDIRSPDDLLEFEDLPRIQRVTTLDGQTYLLGDGKGRAVWRSDRLALDILDPLGAQIAEIGLDEIHELVLFEPDLLGATLASPAFWVVGAAAAGLVVWINGRQDEEGLATR
jgi:hypothetical protein